MKKQVLGLVEKVKIIGNKNIIEKKALIDTGAARTSIDLRTAAKAGLGPVVGTVKIKTKASAKGFVRRLVAECEIEIRGKRIKTRANLEDRQNMEYKILIGRDIIKPNFVVDIEHNE